MDEAQHIPPGSLMAEVAAEERIIGTKEAQALQHNILTAVNAYYEYLNQNGLFFDHERELLRASALIVTCDMNGEIKIVLKDGAIDRGYGTGGDPDPKCRNLNPTRWMP
jgi:argininosuccinate synthase